MLHAVRNGKSKLYRRYLGERDSSEQKIFEEDEITSTILGPHDFLSASEVYCFWKSLLEFVGYVGDLPLETPTCASVILWPSRSARDSGQRIEPDATIVFTWPGNIRYTLLFEFKWRAPLSGEDQLHRQWLYFLEDSERNQAVHLFIAPQISAGAAAPLLDDVWQTTVGSRLVLASWIQIRNVLGGFAKQDSPLGRWSTLADKFLEKIGIRRFSGFSHLLESLPPIDEISHPLFWQPFKGVAALCSALEFPEAIIPKPLFFHSNKEIV